MDIFSADPGTVVLADVRDGTPMNLHLDGWGGYNSFRSVIHGFKVTLKGGVQFMHTLNEFIYVYTFGERMGQIQVSGVSFYQDCQGMNEVMQGLPDHGMKEVIGYYGLNRVNVRPHPVTIVMGTSTVFQAFLTDFYAELADQERLVGTWNMTFAAIPG